MGENFSSMAAFIWQVADLQCGDFKQSQYGRVVLPFTLLRPMECVLAAEIDGCMITARQDSRLYKEGEWNSKKRNF